MTSRKNSEKKNQNRTEIAEGRNFVYLDMFIKLVFRENNIACMRILPLLIVKTNSLAIFQWY